MDRATRGHQPVRIVPASRNHALQHTEMPPSSVVVVPKAARLIVDALKADILGGRVEPGDVLPRPEELARRFGVSRPTIREALNVLELQGLVRLKRGPRGGAIVRLPSHELLTTALGDLLQVEGTTLQHLWEVRLVLEPAGARLAATRITEDQLAALAESLERQRVHLAEHSTWLVENIIFHTAIARAAGNPVLKVFMEALRELIYREGMSAAMTESDRRRSTEEHAQILAALCARDAAHAEGAFHSHLARSIVITHPARKAASR
jgi:GntR family transcriptional repressor for pyruvate dehydrogenase complex